MECLQHSKDSEKHSLDKDYEWRSCKSKRRYRDLNACKHTANMFEQRVYFCDECSGYHLTKKRDYYEEV